MCQEWRPHCSAESVQTTVGTGRIIIIIRPNIIKDDGRSTLIVVDIDKEEWGAFSVQ